MMISQLLHFALDHSCDADHMIVKTAKPLVSGVTGSYLAMWSFSRLLLPFIAK